MMSLKQQRLITRSAFFILFVIAPVLDIFRLDLYEGNFILFGFDWTLGLEPYQRGEMGGIEAAINVLYRGFLPLAGIVGIGIWLAWRYGRIYCGWLCPHFSVVETINHLMLRASGKPSIWEAKKLPSEQADGSQLSTNRLYWLWTVVMAIAIGFLWAVSLMTYLLPPDVIYPNLFNAELTRNQSLFIGVATLLFTLEFLFARHLFCRFGCAVGLFQSIVWMANPKAMEVTFDVRRGDACKSCVQACDNACPMRLKPRKRKRHMFTCTQCSECIQACHVVQDGKGLLSFEDGGSSLVKKVIPIKAAREAE